AQRILEGAVLRAADDTFARRILEYTRDKERNKVLTNFSNVDAKAVERAFMRRMRDRYGSQVPIETVEIAQGDWWAFRLWAENSEDDRERIWEFWRRYIEKSPKRLAQAINFIYPGGVVWSSDPRPLVGSLLPLEEVQRLMQELEGGEPLNPV